MNISFIFCFISTYLCYSYVLIYFQTKEKPEELTHCSSNDMAKDNSTDD